MDFYEKFDNKFVSKDNKKIEFEVEGEYISGNFG